MSKKQLIKEGSGVVFHYTSLDSLFKILDGIKDNQLFFHGTDIFSMNDPTEFIHGFKQLWKILPQIEKDIYDRIRNNPQFCIDNILLEKRFRLSNMWNRMDGRNKQWLKVYVEEIHKSYRSPFVVSFSCHEDFLPMWSTYGDKGHGIAIGIDIQSYYRKSKLDDETKLYDLTTLSDDDLFSLLVSYDTITKNHPLAVYAQLCIKNYLDKIQSPEIDDEKLFYLQLKALDNLTIYASALLKNNAYNYEEESRLVCNRNEINDVQFKISSTKKVLPYILIGVPISKLKKIVIGPCCDYKSIKIAIQACLQKQEICLNDEDIIKSKVPYRVY